MLTRADMPSRSAAAFVMLMIAGLPGCALEPRTPATDVATSTEPAEPARPAVAGELPRDSTPLEEQRPVASETTSPPSTPDTPPAAAVAQRPEPKSRDSSARDEPSGIQSRTAFYRADANQPPTMPPVQLSKGHEALCRVKVGDTMPTIELDQLGGGRRRLADLAGKKGTVVVFWKADRRMARQELADLGPDVAEPFGGAGVAVVGVAVSESAAVAQGVMERAAASFPNLLDADGKAFAQIGREKLPRTFLLDPQGKILWFDIEYSQATRRELHQALRALLVDNH